MIQKIDAIFMNSKDSEISETYKLLINLADKKDIRRSYKHIALSNLSIHYTCKNIEEHILIITFKISAATRKENLSYLTVHIMRYSKLF